ncbi:MAG: hypothetical protein ACP5VR_06270 [Acidimicrobiales bacterium]
MSSPVETAIYVGLEIGWALAALLVLTRVSVTGGTALAAGVGALELGYLISDTASSVQVYNADTPGVWLALAGLGFGIAGVLLGCSTVHIGGPRLPVPSQRQPRAVLTTAAAFLAAAAFLPSWDRFSAVSTVTGRSASFTAGNAFSQPGAVMAGDLVVALAIVVLPAAGVLWEPARVGAWASAGVLLALASQLGSALVQVDQGISPALSSSLMHSFGVTPAEAQGLGVHFSVSLTHWWTVDVAATAVLAALVTWDALSAQHRNPLAQGYEQAGGGGYGAESPWRGDPAPAPGATGQSQPAPSGAALWPLGQPVEPGQPAWPEHWPPPSSWPN